MFHEFGSPLYIYNWIIYIYSLISAQAVWECFRKTDSLIHLLHLYQLHLVPQHIFCGFVVSNKGQSSRAAYCYLLSTLCRSRKSNYRKAEKSDEPPVCSRCLGSRSIWCQSRSSWFQFAARHLLYISHMLQELLWCPCHVMSYLTKRLIIISGETHSLRQSQQDTAMTMVSLNLQTQYFFGLNRR